LEVTCLQYLRRINYLWGKREALTESQHTFVKVPAHEEHSVANTGTDDLIFLVIYDPPHVATD